MNRHLRDDLVAAAKTFLREFISKTPRISETDAITQLVRNVVRTCEPPAKAKLEHLMSAHELTHELAMLAVQVESFISTNTLESGVVSGVTSFVAALKNKSKTKTVSVNVYGPWKGHVEVCCDCTVGELKVSIFKGAGGLLRGHYIPQEGVVSNSYGTNSSVLVGKLQLMRNGHLMEDQKLVSEYGITTDCEERSSPRILATILYSQQEKMALEQQGVLFGTGGSIQSNSIRFILSQLNSFLFEHVNLSWEACCV